MKVMRAKGAQMKTYFSECVVILRNNYSFLNNYENTLRFKSKSWESLDESHKKAATTAKGHDLGSLEKPIRKQHAEANLLENTMKVEGWKAAVKQGQA